MPDTTIWAAPLANGALLLALTFVVQRALRSHDKRLRALEDHDKRLRALEDVHRSTRKLRAAIRNNARRLTRCERRLAGCEAILSITTGRVHVMPYELRQAGEDWEVINTETGEVKATHSPPDAKDKAERQLRLLQGVEHDWEPEQ